MAAEYRISRVESSSIIVVGDFAAKFPADRLENIRNRAINIFGSVPVTVPERMSAARDY